MSQVPQSILIEILIDLKMEIEAIHQCLLLAEIPALTQDGLQDDQQQQRESTRNALLAKYPALRPSS